MSLAAFWLLTGTMIAVSAVPGPADAAVLIALGLVSLVAGASALLDLRSGLTV